MKRLILNSSLALCLGLLGANHAFGQGWPHIELNPSSPLRNSIFDPGGATYRRPQLKESTSWIPVEPSYFGNVFKTTGAGTYVRRSGKSWIKRQGSRTYRFVEVERTGHSIGLKCVSGDHNHVRIYRDFVRYRQRDDRGNVVWRTYAHSRGRWLSN